MSMSRSIDKQRGEEEVDVIYMRLRGKGLDEAIFSPISGIMTATSLVCFLDCTKFTIKAATTHHMKR